MTKEDRVYATWLNVFGSDEAEHPDPVVDGCLHHLHDAAEHPTRDELMELVDALRRPEPCRLDHNGDCQEHWTFGEGPCPHGTANAMFEED